MQLTEKTISKLDGRKIELPQSSLLALPEKVLQFGTGVLLRGLPDYFIDKANKQGIFNGRVVVVKSTSTGDTNDFQRQNNLYTLIEKGVENGETVERISVNASISRVLSAHEEWDAIMECAANPAMQLILSNTTEVGIMLYEPDAYAVKPVSFPGRVLVFLEERYRVFNGEISAGMVIVPTELIVDNGNKLKEIIYTLARLKGLSDAFMQWLNTANEFCNSLVDRIVPGKLPAAEQAATEKKLGYEDALMIMSEPYRLWAIETQKESTRKILSFSDCDEGVFLSPDINKFRELKLRLLNATHTLSCGLAHLAGFTTVREALQKDFFVNYVSQLMYREIAPLVASDTISEAEAKHFAEQVIDRFQNPSIEHLWLSITVQYSSKMKMRTVSLVEKYYVNHTEAPELMALGFAAFLLFMRGSRDEKNEFLGESNGERYRIQDEKAAAMANHWRNNGIDTIAAACLKDATIFGKELSNLPGFTKIVSQYLLMLTEEGVEKTVRSIFAKKYSHE
ncbi:MAG: tagaturonate reductase [Bacteroidota bacterium]